MSKVLFGFLALTGCSSSIPRVQLGSSSDDAAACPAGQALAATSYDVTKSRFAFGGTPVETSRSGTAHWTGPDGALATFANGYTLAILNAGAPEMDIASLSGTEATLTAYVRDYYVAMGVAPCQIASSVVESYSESSLSVGDASAIIAGSVTLGLKRGVSGIPVAESLANAVFDVDYQTTSESFYWPEIPADVVASATALQAKLSDPMALAAYKAKLPKDAQESGMVVIHHTSGSLSFDPFQAVATYDVPLSVDGGDENPNASFDEHGAPVTLPP